MLIPWLVLLSSIVNGGAPPAAAAAAPAPAATATAVEPDPIYKQWQLNGIGLGDQAIEVKGTWGSPSKIDSDEWRNECEIWSYGDGKNVGMCDGAVSFVQITAAAKKANLNGHDIAMVNRSLRQALGKAEFAADDGWGVVKGAEALKVFVDDRGKLVSLDLFSDPCSL
jgi:hypothetical protein